METETTWGLAENLPDPNGVEGVCKSRIHLSMQRFVNYFHAIKHPCTLPEIMDCITFMQFCARDAASEIQKCCGESDDGTLAVETAVACFLRVSNEFLIGLYPTDSPSNSPYSPSSQPPGTPLNELRPGLHGASLVVLWIVRAAVSRSTFCEVPDPPRPPYDRNQDRIRKIIPGRVRDHF